MSRKRITPRVSPLPQRYGLDAICWSVPPGHPPISVIQALAARFPPMAQPPATPLAERFDAGEIVRADGAAWHAEDLVRPQDLVWFHREFAPEDVPEIPLDILHQDEHLVVLDKPHNLATMPRGSHIIGSALARLRRHTGIATLTPLHRLDRQTAGVLMFGVKPEERSAYQQMFSRAGRAEGPGLRRPAGNDDLPAASSSSAPGHLRKVYHAVTAAPDQDTATIPALPAVGEWADRTYSGDTSRAAFPAVGEWALWEDCLEKPHGQLQGRVLPGEPNARTSVRLLRVADGRALWELHPHTGRTHQLRLQLWHRGLPIMGDDL